MRRIALFLFLTFAASFVFANDWETLPVFNNGRIMPLHTYARQTIKDICGTEKPFLVRDDAVLNELNRLIELFRNQKQQQDRYAADISENEQYRFLVRGNDLNGGFGKEYSIFDADRQEMAVQSALPIKGLTRQRAEHLAERIRTLIPIGGRYFSADELLLSMVIEPEVWMFIPVFRVHDMEYAEDILELNFASDSRTIQHRASLYQLTKASRYQQRLADILRKQQLGQSTDVPIRYDQITQQLETKAEMFRELTYHPRRSKPKRMIQLLEQASGLHSRDASYAVAFDAWRYLLQAGEVPMRQSTEPIVPGNENDLYRTVHPATQRWHDIAGKILLLTRVFNRTDSLGNMIPPNTDAVERQFELLIGMLDKTLEESGTLMETLYPGIRFHLQDSADNDVNKLLPLLMKPETQQQNSLMLKRLIPSYHYAVKQLRYEVEAAYIALYDENRTLRVLPIHSILACGGYGDGHETFGVQPWGTVSMIASAGEAFIKRFFDPQFSAPSVQPPGKNNQDASLPVKTRPAAGEKPEENTGKEERTDIPKEPEDAADPLAAVNRSIRELSSNGNKKENAESKTALPDSEQEKMTEAEKKQKAAEKKLQTELFAQQQNDEELIYAEDMSSGKYSGIINKVRTTLGQLLLTYSTVGVEYGDTRFKERANALQNALQEAAEKIDVSRAQTVKKNGERNEEGTSQLSSTAYPAFGATLPEYKYMQFAPFFWMFIFGGLSAVVGIGTYFWGSVRRQFVVAETYTIHTAAVQKEESRPDYTNSLEEGLNSVTLLLLFLAVLITFIGGVMRARITGWTPVTNMYETVVFTAFCAGLFGLWYSLYPLIQPVLQLGWKYTRFPPLVQLIRTMNIKNSTVSKKADETDGEFAMRQAALEFGMPPAAFEEQGRHEHIAANRLFWQAGMVLPRIIVMCLTLYGTVMLCNGAYAAEYGFAAALFNMFAVNDVLDSIVIGLCTAALVWYLPRFILMFVPAPFLLFMPAVIASELGIVSFKKVELRGSDPRQRSEMSKVFETSNVTEQQDISGTVWLISARNAILDRKLFTVIAAVVLVAAGLAAYLNSTEFNPDIKPLTAVLRSNFWLTVHVIAIIASYAAAFVAWGLATIALGSVVFGKFERGIELTEYPDRRSFVLPPMCLQFAPLVDKLLKVSLLLLILGTVLGARWADYSWGRFWGWDPKEVWALITILFYVIVFHGRIAQWYGQVGIIIGAQFASIAVIITWYGINFVFKSGMHAYGSGDTSNASLFLGLFIVANILWGTLAVLRCAAEKYGGK